MSKELQETYDRIAEDWHRDHSHDDWWVEGTDFFISQLPRGGSILDVGCGSGIKSKYLLGHGLRVLGIDISKKLLDIARREAPQGQYQLLSMTELNSSEETFDGVFAQASLLHIPKKDASNVIKQITDRTKKNAHVYIAVKEIQPGQPQEGMLKENDYGYEYERFFSYYTMPELVGYFETAGLTVIWQNISGHKTRWLQIIGKK